MLARVLSLPAIFNKQSCISRSPRAVILLPLPRTSAGMRAGGQPQLVAPTVCHFTTGSSYEPLARTSCDSDLEAGDASHGLANWMGTHAEVLAPLRLDQLLLPGTHDSGAYTLAPNDEPLSCGCGDLGASLLHSLMPQSVSEWTLAQELSVGQQCARGIRFFDLRLAVARRRGSAPDSIVITHTFACIELSEALMAIAGFLFRCPKEVVVLRLTPDWQHRKGFTEADGDEVMHLLNKILGEHMYDHVKDAPTAAEAAAAVAADSYRDPHVFAITDVGEKHGNTDGVRIPFRLHKKHDGQGTHMRSVAASDAHIGSVCSLSSIGSSLTRSSDDDGAGSTRSSSSCSTIAGAAGVGLKPTAQRSVEHIPLLQQAQLHAQHQQQTQQQQQQIQQQQPHTPTQLPASSSRSAFDIHFRTSFERRRAAASLHSPTSPSTTFNIQASSATSASCSAGDGPSTRSSGLSSPQQPGDSCSPTGKSVSASGGSSGAHHPSQAQHRHHGHRMSSGGGVHHGKLFGSRTGPLPHAARNLRPHKQEQRQAIEAARRAQRAARLAGGASTNSLSSLAGGAARATMPRPPGGGAHSSDPEPDDLELPLPVVLPTVGRMIARGRRAAVLAEFPTSRPATNAWIHAGSRSIWADDPSPEGTLFGLLARLQQAQRSGDIDRAYHFLAMAVTPNVNSMLRALMAGFEGGLRTLAPPTEALLPQLLAVDLHGVGAITLNFPSIEAVEEVVAMCIARAKAHAAGGGQVLRGGVVGGFVKGGAFISGLIDGEDVLGGGQAAGPVLSSPLLDTTSRELLLSRCQSSSTRS